MGSGGCGTWALGVVAHGLRGLWHLGLVVVVHGLSCSVAFGIFLDQGLNPCPVHSQVDSMPPGKSLQLNFLRG